MVDLILNIENESTKPTEKERAVQGDRRVWGRKALIRTSRTTTSYCYKPTSKSERGSIPNNCQQGDR